MSLIKVKGYFQAISELYLNTFIFDIRLVFYKRNMVS